AGKLIGVAHVFGAARTRQKRQADDAGAGFELRAGGGAVIENFSAEFVAEDDALFGLRRQRVAGALQAGEKFVHVIARVQIGAADTAGQRAHQHLSGRRYRLVDIAQFKFAVLRDYAAHIQYPSHGFRAAMLPLCDGSASASSAKVFVMLGQGSPIAPELRPRNGAWPEVDVSSEILSRNRAAEINDLKNRAEWIRLETIRLVEIAKSGHYSSVFSCAELFSALYYHTLRLQPSAPRWPDRDRLLL